MINSLQFFKNFPVITVNFSMNMIKTQTYHPRIIRLTESINIDINKKSFLLKNIVGSNAIITFQH